MIQPRSWRKLHLRCAQLTSDRPALLSSNRMIKITSLLYDIRPPIYQSKLHIHSEYELIVFLDVDGSSEDRMRERNVVRGQTRLFSPEIQHTGHLTDTSCQVLAVRFSMKPILAIPMMEPWPVSLELANDAEILSEMLLDAVPGDMSYASSHLMTLILHALSLFTPEEHTVKPVDQKLDLPEEIERLVINNPARQYTLEDIASHFGMSVRHLSRSFHSETQDTVIGHIIRCRLNIARSLLLESDNKISDICARIGIPDQPYFCRCFRQYFGLTPGEYRKMARKNAPHLDESANITSI